MDRPEFIELTMDDIVRLLLGTAEGICSLRGSNITDEERHTAAEILSMLMGRTPSPLSATVSVIILLSAMLSTMELFEVPATEGKVQAKQGAVDDILKSIKDKGFIVDGGEHEC